MKNVRPGVCGLCGTAVVQPDGPVAGWLQGHLFERKLVAGQTKVTELVLARVRCMSHKEGGDPRHYDRNGIISEERDLDFSDPYNPSP